MKYLGLIIGEVQRGEVTVFAVEHIIPKQNIFGPNNFFLDNRATGKFVKAYRIRYRKE